LSQQARERGNEAEGLVSVAQAAALLGVHPNTVRTWTDAGRLAAYRINSRGDRRYRRSDVEALLAEGAGAVPAQPASDEDAGRHDAEMTVLVRLAHGSGASATVAAVCRSAIEALRTGLGVARAAIYLGDDQGDAPDGEQGDLPAAGDAANVVRERKGHGATPASASR